eukprot:783440-Rhodomonas_salina.1
MVFRLRDNDDFAKEEQLEEMKIQRTKIRNKLKKLNLQVREQVRAPCGLTSAMRGAMLTTASMLPGKQRKNAAVP